MTFLIKAEAHLIPPARNEQGVTVTVTRVTSLTISPFRLQLFLFRPSTFNVSTVDPYLFRLPDTRFLDTYFLAWKCG